MTSGDLALRRILARAGEPELVDLLTERLSGADLTTLLLEVCRRRAGKLSPADVMRRYRNDRFVAPASADFTALRRVEDAFVAALPPGSHVLVLAPLVPLATHSAVTTVDPRKVIATIRGSEVAADTTNALALEAALRRTEDPSATPVRLAASQRVTRAQHVDAPGMLAHFQLLALVTAGRATPNRTFEREHLAEHLRFAATAVTAAGGKDVEVRLTCLDPAYATVADRIRRELADIDIRDDPDRPGGRGYYSGLCFKVHAAVGGRQAEIGDGGFVDWTARLTGNRKERLLISGFGLDRLA